MINLKSRLIWLTETVAMGTGLLILLACVFDWLI
ncbi:hypothetical protein N836_20165 [Leptolyngbya sp. Heron Island J]|nr:hypothetical protein N836_20165 [Leptolyngbya sp. Heron Island J]